MASDETSAPRAKYVGIPLGIAFLAASVLGNTYIVEYIDFAIHRPWLSEFVEHHVIWANVIYLYATILVMLAFVFLGLYFQKRDQDVRFVVLFLIGLLVYFTSVVIGIFASIAIGWRFVSPAAYNFIEAHQLRFLPFVVTVAVALVASYSAYYVRTKKRIHYGVGELAFGVGSILFSVYSFVLSIFAKEISDGELWRAIFSFFTGVYIIVRGLTNIEDGLKRGPLTPSNALDILSGLINQKIGRSRSRK